MKQKNILETDLLIRFLGKETSQQENETINNWLEESDNNKAFFEKIKSVWEDSGSHEILDKKYNTDETWNKLLNNHIQKTSKIPNSRKLFNRLAIAATILLLIGTGIGMYFINYEKDTTVLANNKVTKITFPDNSIVWLNRNSKLTYKKSYSKNRQVKLSGEGYFDVKPDPSNPFEITTNNTKVTVVGTRFNVQSYPTDTATIVVVTSGKVKISALNNNIEGKKEILVLPGEKGVNSSNLNHPEKILSNNPNYMSWKTREFTFNNTNIREIVTLVNEIYNTNITLTDTSTENCNLTGRYNCQSLDDMLDMLRIVLNITIEKDGQNIIIKTNGC